MAANQVTGCNKLDGPNQFPRLATVVMLQLGLNDVLTPNLREDR